MFEHILEKKLGKSSHYYFSGYKSWSNIIYGRKLKKLSKSLMFKERKRQLFQLFDSAGHLRRYALILHPF